MRVEWRDEMDGMERERELALNTSGGTNGITKIHDGDLSRRNRVGRGQDVKITRCFDEMGKIGRRVCFASDSDK